MRVPPLAEEVARRLAGIEGVLAVVLGGSHARGIQQPDSDIDLGLYYREASPFSIDAVRALAEELNDTPSPVVTDFGRWGPWVNGGAWLTVRGQRLDFIYRSLDAIERVAAECREGRFESEFFLQQPPYGFHSYVYLGEVSVCIPLFDPDGLLPRLKEALSPYPEPLKRAIVDRFLWAAEFTLEQGRKLAGRGDVYGGVGCLARCAASLVQALYALNERYFVHDKGAPEEIAGFPQAPARFAERLTAGLSTVGDAESLRRAGAEMEALTAETLTLCGDLYRRPDFRT